jgi:Flp pilus assembly secretin CpaC
MEYKIVSDSSGDLMSLADVPFASAPLVIRTAERAFTDNAELDVCAMQDYLADYRGKIGRLADAGALLKAIDGSGREMRIPNICLAPNETTTLNIADYINETAKSVEVVNDAIATASLSGNVLYISAKSEGQTSLTLITENGTKHYATITVREGAANGWL